MLMSASRDATNPGACLGDPVPAPSATHPLQDGVGTGNSWSIVELVEFGLKRAEEAERKLHRYIVVTEIFRGSSRISSRIEEHRTVVNVILDYARQQRRAFVVLHFFEGDGWCVHAWGNLAGKVADIDAAIRRMGSGSSTRPTDQGTRPSS
jgi:hypothetical protein